MDPSEKLVEVGATIKPAVGDHRDDLPRIVDVLERAAVEKH